MPVNPYEAYKKQSVMTMTQGEMLTKLYEEIVKQLSAAEMYIGQKDYNRTNDALQRSQKILRHLKNTLNDQYEISGSLNVLYDYFLECTVEANIKKSIEPIHDIIPMVDELRETFIKADKLARNHSGNPA